MTDKATSVQHSVKAMAMLCTHCKALINLFARIHAKQPFTYNGISVLPRGSD